MWSTVGSFVANLLRGTVRCLFPLACLAVLGALVYSDQGRDVLIALIEFAAGTEHGNSIAGLLFLAAGCSALGASVWYSMRWLLLAQMAALPLPEAPGWFRRWMPRALGALAPAMVALGLWTRGGDHPDTARFWALVFAAVAVAFVVITAWRGDLLVALRKRGWALPLEGRAASGQPAALRAEDPLPGLTLRIVVWSIVLTLVIGVMMFVFRLTLPRVIGAAAVAAIALASINLFGSFVLTYAPLRHGLPPLAPWVLGAAAVMGLWNDNHEVATVAGPTAPRPALEADFERFLATLPPSASGPPTVLFVASEGGGIRAAYWTAAVLEQLAARSPELFRHNLYALSGVSGGSLGVSAWLMSHRADWCPQAAAEPVGARSQQARTRATTSLGMDFVAPAVAGLFYYDLAQRFWPWPVPAFDRSRTMEAGWQNAFAQLPGQPFAQTLDALYAACPGLPRLLLNATVVETGQRAVLGPLALDKADDENCNHDGLYPNAMPAMTADLATRHQPLAGLVHHSARFPVVSPAGTVTRKPKSSCPSAFRLVDGGYFDNSGAQTVLDIVLRLRANTAFKFRPLVLMVRNAASPLCAQVVDERVEPSRVAPETTAVIDALLNARGSHAVLARAALLRAGIDVVDLAVRADTDAANAPLGWALSDHVRKTLDQEAQQAAQRGLPILATGSDGCDARP